MGNPPNVEMEAAKFLQKLIHESKDEPTKLATKLYVILQHMRSSGKENSMPYQVISRAMKTVIEQHNLDIDALMSSRLPVSAAAQVGDSSSSQMAGSSQRAGGPNNANASFPVNELGRPESHASTRGHAGPSSGGQDIYRGNSPHISGATKVHGMAPSVSGTYPVVESGVLSPMHFGSSQYDNPGFAPMMHNEIVTEAYSGSSSAGKAVDHEGGTLAGANKVIQAGVLNSTPETSTLKSVAPRDTTKSPASSMPFKEQQLRQLRAQCLVFLSFRNGLMPKKLHLELALGNILPKDDAQRSEFVDHKGKEQYVCDPSNAHEVTRSFGRVDNAGETDRMPPGSSSSLMEASSMQKAENHHNISEDRSGPPSVQLENTEDGKRHLTSKKPEAEETTESQASLPRGLPTELYTRGMAGSNDGNDSKNTRQQNGTPNLASFIAGTGQANSQRQSPPGFSVQAGRLSESNLLSFPSREQRMPVSGVDGYNHLALPVKDSNKMLKIQESESEEEDDSVSTDRPPSPKYTTVEKWILYRQKRKVLTEQRWAQKQQKTEQKIASCSDRLKENVSSSEDICAKTKSMIELKKLQLLELQRRLRSDILNDFFKPIAPDMDRLKSIKKHRIGRKSKQLERYEHRMKEERQKRIGERQKEFFSEIDVHRERLDDMFKMRRERWKGFNKYVREFHKRKERIHREKIDRIQREKINLLKINDVEGYLRMVQDAKSDRVKQLLKETEKYLQKLGAKLQKAKSTARRFDTEMDESRTSGFVEKTEVAAEDEDDTDQAKHYLESNEKYYMMAHSVKENITDQPTSLIGGKLREYQMNGLRWLVSLYNNHLNGILADEMGLGKTVQVISLICYLMENKNDRGPFLVVVPSSVLPGWESEINFWAPSIHKIVYSGPPEERRKMFKEQIVHQKFNVLLTTYEYLMNKHDRPKLSKVHWHYIIIDEGHRIKNASCKLNADLKHYRSNHRLLLTGTPLQNNLEELWALLNFLLPNIFNSSEDFSQWFNKPFQSNGDNSPDEALLSEEENLLIINRLHQVLRPFVLRRLKHKVENELPEKIERLVRCEPSAYQKLLMKRVEENLGAIGTSKARTVHNSVMELRNICNHPYLSQLHVEEVHDLIPKHYLPNIVRLCGKLEMLDRLLPKLKATDHRVLLFSTMTRLLDVMEDYLCWKQYKYLRLDGHTSGGDRGALIDLFNQPGSPFFIFLLSIRAGGVGVNLQAADTVIIFDTDWNPQVDLQAQARAHRIGQKKDVLVLRLETVQTVEEQVRAAAEHKLGVANQSITAGFFDNNTSAEDRREYLESLLRECKKEEAAPVLDDDALNDLIARSESEIDIFESVDKLRQEEEMAEWKQLIIGKGAENSELKPPLPPRLLTDDDLKAFCEAMKINVAPHPVVASVVGVKRKSESLGGLDTQHYGRGKRAREIRSYEEQWTEEEFERMCQGDSPGSPDHKEETAEKKLQTITSDSVVAAGEKEVASVPNSNLQPIVEVTVLQNKEVTPPSKRGRGRPKKTVTAPGIPVPLSHPTPSEVSKMDSHPRVEETSSSVLHGHNSAPLEITTGTINQAGVWTAPTAQSTPLPSIGLACQSTPSIASPVQGRGRGRKTQAVEGPRRRGRKQKVISQDVPVTAAPFESAKPEVEKQGGVCPTASTASEPSPAFSCATPGEAVMRPNTVLSLPVDVPVTAAPSEMPEIVKQGDVFPSPSTASEPSPVFSSGSQGEAVMRSNSVLSLPVDVPVTAAPSAKPEIEHCGVFPSPSSASEPSPVFSSATPGEAGMRPNAILSLPVLQPSSVAGTMDVGPQQISDVPPGFSIKISTDKEDPGSRTPPASVLAPLLPPVTPASQTISSLSEPKRGKGRGAKPKVASEGPRRRGRRLESAAPVVLSGSADQDMKSGEPLQKRARVAAGRKASGRNNRDDENQKINPIVELDVSHSIAGPSIGEIHNGEQVGDNQKKVNEAQSEASKIPEVEHVSISDREKANTEVKDSLLIIKDASRTNDHIDNQAESLSSTSGPATGQICNCEKVSDSQEKRIDSQPEASHSCGNIAVEHVSIAGAEEVITAVKDSLCELPLSQNREDASLRSEHIVDKAILTSSTLVPAIDQIYNGEQVSYSESKKIDAQKAQSCRNLAVEHLSVADAEEASTVVKGSLRESVLSENRKDASLGSEHTDNQAVPALSTSGPSLGQIYNNEQVGRSQENRIDVQSESSQNPAVKHVTIADVEPVITVVKDSPHEPPFSESKTDASSRSEPADTLTVPTSCSIGPAIGQIHNGDEVSDTAERKNDAQLEASQSADLADEHVSVADTELIISQPESPLSEMKKDASLKREHIDIQAEPGLKVDDPVSIETCNGNPKDHIGEDMSASNPESPLPISGNSFKKILDLPRKADGVGQEGKDSVPSDLLRLNSSSPTSNETCSWVVKDQSLNDVNDTCERLTSRQDRGKESEKQDTSVDETSALLAPGTPVSDLLGQPDTSPEKPEDHEKKDTVQPEILYPEIVFSNVDKSANLLDSGEGVVEQESKDSVPCDVLGLKSNLLLPVEVRTEDVKDQTLYDSHVSASTHGTAAIVDGTNTEKTSESRTGEENGDKAGEMGNSSVDLSANIAPAFDLLVGGSDSMCGEQEDTSGSTLKSSTIIDSTRDEVCEGHTSVEDGVKEGEMQQSMVDDSLALMSPDTPAPDLLGQPDTQSENFVDYEKKDIVQTGILPDTLPANVDNSLDLSGKEEETDQESKDAFPCGDLGMRTVSTEGFHVVVKDQTLDEKDVVQTGILPEVLPANVDNCLDLSGKEEETDQESKCSASCDVLGMRTSSIEGCSEDVKDQTLDASYASKSPARSAASVDGNIDKTCESQAVGVKKVGEIENSLVEQDLVMSDQETPASDLLIGGSGSILREQDTSASTVKPLIIVNNSVNKICEGHISKDDGEKEGKMQHTLVDEYPVLMAPGIGGSDSMCTKQEDMSVSAVKSLNIAYSSVDGTCKDSIYKDDGAEEGQMRLSVVGETSVLLAPGTPASDLFGQPNSHSEKPEDHEKEEPVLIEILVPESAANVDNSLDISVNQDELNQESEDSVPCNSLGQPVSHLEKAGDHEKIESVRTEILVPESAQANVGNSVVLSRNEEEADQESKESVPCDVLGLTSDVPASLESFTEDVNEKIESVRTEIVVPESAQANVDNSVDLSGKEEETDQESKESVPCDDLGLKSDIPASLESIAEDVDEKIVSVRTEILVPESAQANVDNSVDLSGKEEETDQESKESVPCDALGLKSDVPASLESIAEDVDEKIESVGTEILVPESAQANVDNSVDLSGKEEKTDQESKESVPCDVLGSISGVPSSLESLTEDVKDQVHAHDDSHASASTLRTAAQVDGTTDEKRKGQDGEKVGEMEKASMESAPDSIEVLHSTSLINDSASHSVGVALNCSDFQSGEQDDIGEENKYSASDEVLGFDSNVSVNQSSQNNLLSTSSTLQPEVVSLVSVAYDSESENERENISGNEVAEKSGNFVQEKNSDLLLGSVVSETGDCLQKGGDAPPTS